MMAETWFEAEIQMLECEIEGENKQIGLSMRWERQINVESEWFPTVKSEEVSAQFPTEPTSVVGDKRYRCGCEHGNLALAFLLCAVASCCGRLSLAGSGMSSEKTEVRCFCPTCRSASIQFTEGPLRAGARCILSMLMDSGHSAHEYE
jgi:hypothetical protein